MTGGTGQIGTTLLPSIARAAEYDRIVCLARGDNQEFEPPTPNVELHRVDVGQYDELAWMFDLLAAENCRLDIYHLAGAMQPSMVSSAQSFQAVAAGKALGGWNLHRLSQKYDVDRFVIFSSWSSVLGARGLVDYSAANGFLNGLHRTRLREGLPSTNFLWGIWESTAADIDLLKSTGIKAISTARACSMFETALHESSHHEFLLVEADWRTVSAGYKACDRDAALKTLVEPAANLPSGLKPEPRTGLEVLSEIIGAEDFQLDARLEDIGVTSIVAAELAAHAASQGIHFEAHSMYTAQTVSDLVELFEQGTISGVKTKILDRVSKDIGAARILTRGIGLIAPAGINSVEKFWSTIREDARLEPQTINAPGGVQHLFAINDVSLFDHEKFGISAAESMMMDPQHRLTLEVVEHAVTDSGIAKEALSQRRTGVYVGLAASEYAAVIKRSGATPSSFILTGNAQNMAAGRVSSHYDLSGPTMTIDTACSSSAAALYQAYKDLTNNECDFAIVVGVNLCLDVEAFNCLSSSGVISRRGICDPLSEEADGYVRSEAAACVILQRVTTDECATNNAYSEIVFAGCNHDGRATTLTSPNPIAQEQLLREGIGFAETHGFEVEYLELHGTGTKLGDPLEIGSIDRAYSSIARQRPLKVGALKRLLGHSEAAAGLMSFIKLSACATSACLPANRVSGELNRSLASGERFFYQYPEAELNSERGLLAMNCFGVSGTNIHILCATPQEAKQIPNTCAGISGTRFWVDDGESSFALRKRATATVPKQNVVPINENLAEHWLQALVREFAQVERDVSGNSSLAELGIDSLGIVALERAVYERSGYTLDLTSVTPDTRVLELDDLLLAAANEDDITGPPFELPLSDQQAMLLASCLEPEQSIDTLVNVLSIVGRNDIPHLIRACQAIVDGTDCLGMCLDPKLEKLVPCPDGSSRVMPCVDTSAMTSAAKEKLVERFAHRPFNLFADSLIRFAFFVDDDDQDLFVVSAHHLVADLRSLQVMQDFANGDDLSFRSSIGTFIDQQSHGHSKRYERVEAYVDTHLTPSVLPLRLPYQTRPASGQRRFATATFSCVNETVQGLKAAAANYSCTLFELALVGYQVSIARLLDVHEFRIGLCQNGRTKREHLDLIGAFVSTLPIDLYLDVDATLREVLEKNRVMLRAVNTLNGATLRDMPGGKECGFHSSFAWDQVLDSVGRRLNLLGDGRLGRRTIQLTTPDDFTVSVVTNGRVMRLSSIYRDDLVDGSYIDELLALFNQTLGRIPHCAENALISQLWSGTEGNQIIEV